MDRDFIAMAKEKLEKKRQSLNERLGETGERVEGDGYKTKFPDYGDDEESAVSEVEDYDTNVGIENDLSKDLKATNLALERIKQGKYGLCLKCGQKIEERRLLAYPAAAVCLNCER